jgi:hypothetical protein
VVVVMVDGGVRMMDGQGRAGRPHDSRAPVRRNLNWGVPPEQFRWGTDDGLAVYTQPVSESCGRVEGPAMSPNHLSWPSGASTSVI